MKERKDMPVKSSLCVAEEDPGCGHHKKNQRILFLSTNIAVIVELPLKQT